ncbi:MAG: hypothetical protein ACRDPK_00400 [Carbonactinosporaceae bacterium]
MPVRGLGELRAGELLSGANVAVPVFRTWSADTGMLSGFPEAAGVSEGVFARTVTV